MNGLLNKLKVGQLFTITVGFGNKTKVECLYRRGNLKDSKGRIQIHLQSINVLYGSLSMWSSTYTDEIFYDGEANVKCV